MRLMLSLIFKVRMDSNQQFLRMRKKRENFIEQVEHEVEKDAGVVADKTGMPPWMVLALFALLLLVIIALLVFCIWRFFAKKRVKKDGAKKSSDEQGLVDGEEEIDINEDDQAKVRIEKFNIKYVYKIALLAS